MLQQQNCVETQICVRKNTKKNKNDVQCKFADAVIFFLSANSIRQTSIGMDIDTQTSVAMALIMQEMEN